MKDLTDEFRDEFNVNLHLDGPGIRIKVPKIIGRPLERKIKVYETESISDIEQNYAILSDVSRIPFRLRMLEIIKSIKYRKGENICFNRYPLVVGSNINLNIAEIENIYLNDFSFFDDIYQKSVEFDIIDKSDDKMKGAFVYEHNPLKSEDEENKRRLEMVIASEGATSFDLVYSALPSERKLLVHYIRRLRGEDEEITEPPNIITHKILPKILQHV